MVIESIGQRQTSTISIPRDNFGERKAKFNLETSRTTQMNCMNAYMFLRFWDYLKG
jgi:hypothetical protein